MHRMVSTSGRALAAMLIAGAAAAADAGPGNGIRLGGSEGRLHPFLDVEARYDSNVSFTPADEAVPDVILHVRPGLELKLPGDLAALEFSGAVDWAEYLGVEEETTKDLSRMYGQGRIAALFARRSPLSVRLDDEFCRHVSTTSLTAASTAVISNVNVLTVSIPWTPGGGALVLTANGQWILETFEKYDERGGPELGDLGYSEYRGGAELKWRFLPRTAAVLQGTYYSRVPSASQPPPAGSGVHIAAVEASGFDVALGLSGLLTPRLAATLKGGYGSTSTLQQEAQSAIADVGLEWLLDESLSFRAGYRRSFGIDPSVSLYVGDVLSAGARLKLAERFAFSAGVRYDRLEFRAVPGAETAYLRVDPTLEGMVGRWLSLGLGYVYSARTATFPGVAPPDYAKNEAFLRLGLTY